MTRIQRAKRDAMNRLDETAAKNTDERHTGQLRHDTATTRKP